MAEETKEGLLPYLDLDGYGKSLLKHYGSAFSDYGLLQRQDCAPVWVFRASNRGAQEISE